MFLPMLRMVARPSASWAASPGMAPNTLFQYVEATTGIWLMVKYLLSTSKVVDVPPRRATAMAAPGLCAKALPPA